METDDFGYYAVKDKVHRSEEHTSELQSLRHLVCRLLLEKKKNKANRTGAIVPIGFLFLVSTLTRVASSSLCLFRAHSSMVRSSRDRRRTRSRSQPTSP